MLKPPTSKGLVWWYLEFGGRDQSRDHVQGSGRTWVSGHVLTSRVSCPSHLGRGSMDPAIDSPF